MSNNAGDPHRCRNGRRGGHIHLRSQENVETPQARSQGRTRQRAQSQAVIPARLFDLEAAATYLAVSPWTIRELEARGVLPRVRVPLPNGGELRKLLFDKADLDHLIDVWKDAAE
jgi:hypothetical protein